MQAKKSRSKLSALAICLATPLSIAALPTLAQNPADVIPADAETLTLSAARLQALKAHSSVQQASALTASAKAREREAHSGKLPMVAIQGAASDGPAGAPAFGSIGNPASFGALPYSVQGLAADPLKKQFGIGLNISQNLFDSGRTQSLTAAKSSLVTAAQEDETAQRSLITLAVTQKYLNVLALQELLSVQKEMLQQRVATEQQAKLFTDAQLKAGVDLQTAAAHTSEARVALIGAENDLRAGFADLNNAMGATSLKSFRLTPVPDAGPVVNGTLETFTEKALRLRPELSSADASLKAEEHTLRGVKSELHPRVDAVASLGIINPGSLIHNSQNYAVGVAVTIPVFTGGQIEGRVQEEKEKQKAAVAQRESVKESIRLQVARAWLELETRRAQMSAARDQMQAANSSLALASERYKLQLSSLIELSDSETTAARARAAFVNARYAVQMASQLLAWASGDPVYVPAAGMKGGK